MVDEKKSGEVLKPGEYRTLYDMVEHSEESISETSDALTRILRIFVHRQGWDARQWHEAVNKFQGKFHALTGNVNSTWVKSNLTGRLGKDNISWGLFLRGMDVMEFDEIEFIVRGKRNKSVMKDGVRVTITHEVVEVDMTVKE